MTDPIIAAAKDDRDRRDAIKALLFDGLDPGTALAAALDLLLVREEDVASLCADVRRLTDERDQARCAARDNAHQHERLLEEHTALQRAIARIVTCPPEEEHAAMADARLLVGEATIARYAGAPTKPEPQPVATVEPAPTPPTKPTPRYEPSPIDHLLGPFAKDRYVAAPADAAKDVPPDRVLWRSAERLASRDADELNRGDRRRDFYGWGPDSTPEFPRWAVVDRGDPIGEED